jgi:ribosomal 50S subunit-recycling heat shock protein
VGVVAPIAFAAFLFSTPTDFSKVSKVVLALGLDLLVFGAPFWVGAYRLNHARKRIDRWLKLNQKCCVTGPVQKTFIGGTHITVNEQPFMAWTVGRALSVGDVVTIEYLGEGHRTDVLRVNGEPNPYFENAVFRGPPGA